MGLCGSGPFQDLLRDDLYNCSARDQGVTGLGVSASTVGFRNQGLGFQGFRALWLASSRGFERFRYKGYYTKGSRRDP